MSCYSSVTWELRGIVLVSSLRPIGPYVQNIFRTALPAAVKQTGIRASKFHDLNYGTQIIFFGQKRVDTVTCSDKNW